MRQILRAAFCLCVFLGALPGNAATPSAKPLQIYFIDVEGGQATLLVTPLGQSLLIDTGWPGNEGRDADRIIAAAHQAGLKQLDYVLITHHHRDHVGGVPQLLDGIKVGTFVDHGPNQEDSEVTRVDYAAYEKAIAGHAHVVVKPGWGLPLKGVEVKVLTAAGEHITSPLPNAGEANSYCAAEPAAAADATENARSVGVLVTYGHFRFLDLGDLTKKKEIELVCPNNPIGTVDLFLVSHHGMDLSNSKALVWAMHPRVAIFDNGARKGASSAAWQIVHDSPGIEDVWQLHYAAQSDKDHNIAEERIANVKENCEGKYLKVAAETDGSFTVTNGRTGVQKTYSKK
ncbi:MAG TPA: MBL fold metallo-hydrolase [Candidatus Sulfotelmatobacter sp.]|jgi:beta-lactamase superfamily II metal-dependent hydrolase|nr:MBL fold metallo-hydrolase [Candidatus Sulfotelmatobacter sp.]